MISSSHTQTHVLMRKQVEKLFGIRSRCVAVVHFNWADTINKQSLSLSILVPSSHFLSSRNSLRIVGKIFPNRHRNNNLYNYLLIAIKQKYNKKRALK